MKQIRTEDAAGCVLCHDMTQIIKDEYKGARFRKGHVVREEDIPVLLSMGKEHLYVWELTPGILHEDEGAERLCALCENEYMTRSETREGKIELQAACDGYFQVDHARLLAVNTLENLMIATRHSGPVRRGDKLAGMRVIPLTIPEETLAAAEKAAEGQKLLSVIPWKMKSAAIVATGSEIQKGLIQDKFTPVVQEKLAAYGIACQSVVYPGDDMEAIAAAIAGARKTGTELILCTGGMSVDPDDNTPGAIRLSGAEIITYGAPVLPGAMFMLGYYADGTAVCGLPGCVMYAKTTIFDLVLPKLAAGIPVTRASLVSLGEGGLCLGCADCRWPVCAFGK